MVHYLFFFTHVKIESNDPDQTTIFKCHQKWHNDSNAEISGREWYDWVEVRDLGERR